MSLFPFAQYWWFYAGFAVFVAALLALDLLAHRNPRPMSMPAAVRWTAVWVLLGLSFSAVVYLLAANRYGSGVATQMSFEYLAGYLVEESLSVDNMFVFALLFGYFNLPGGQQHRVLFYGIVGAMAFRGIFVAAGSALIQFHWVVIAFGVFLILSGLRMGLAKEKNVEPERNPLIRLVRRFFPMTAMRANRFIVREGGVVRFTPLMLIVIVLETTDILFAVDSVPAVFGVTKEPLIVYTSNILAILGLRAMYFVLAGAIGRFHFLKYGLSFVLIFVGLKMALLDDLAGGRLPIGFSLAVILITAVASIALSLFFPRGVGEPESSRRLRIGHVAVGAVFVFLCCTCVALAVGLRPPFLDTLAVEALKPEWLYISGLCHGVCAWVLLNPSTG
jgi:tellurite resistance protein TerC